MSINAMVSNNGSMLVRASENDKYFGYRTEWLEDYGLREGACPCFNPNKLSAHMQLNIIWAKLSDIIKCMT